MATRDWSKGDNVMHAARPEWGAGEVLVAEPVQHEGRACQRLTIRFLRGGTRTISTAFADLRPASDQPRIPTLPEAPAPMAKAEGSARSAPAALAPDPIAKAAVDAAVSELLTKLPDAAWDPFSSLKSRLVATLDLYKYTPTGASLLDWAAVQTGLADPLSRFNRHELEQWFDRFQMELDQHLRRLVREVRKQEPQLLTQVAGAESTGPAARAALRRADSGR